MIERELTIINRLGLHARAASEFVRVAQKYGCDITVSKDSASANGKSIISMMILEASKGTSIVVRCDGEDENDAMNSLTQTIENKFGEEE